MSRRLQREGLTRGGSDRRRLCRWLLVPAVQCVQIAGGKGSAFAASHVQSARLWPAQEYTRLIIESDTPIEHRMSLVHDPERLVLDLTDVELTPGLTQLARHLTPTDPYIRSIRIARYRVDVLRVVLDLKVEVNPQLFALKPVAEFGHRVVLDLYPLVAPDPLMALLEGERKAPPEEASDEPSGEPNGEPSGEPNEEPHKELHEALRGGAEMPGLQQTPAHRRPAEALGNRAPATPRVSRRIIVVAIDPGHGGEDPGAIGRRGTQEKRVTLAIARKLKALVDRESGMRAMLTRDDDYFVPLNVRVQKARRVGADLFISIHADAFTTPDARGSSVFALSDHGATSAAARWLARRENQADLIGGVNLDNREPMLARLLLDLSQTAQINDSLRVGRSVLDGIASVNALHKAEVEQAGFAVLKAPDIPSILVETAFISNPDEELRLRDDLHQTRFAMSILRGIKQYFAHNPSLSRIRAG